MKNSYIRVSVVTIASIIAVTSVIHAWTGPTATPPDNNAQAPINVSDLPQIKTGGLSVGSLIVVGKGISASTIDGDHGSTLVTKDYLDAKIASGGGGGGTCVGNTTRPSQNMLYGPAPTDFFATLTNGNNGGGDDYSYICAGSSATEVSKCYCTLANQGGTCHGGTGTGGLMIKGRAAGYNSASALIKKGEYYYFQHFDEAGNGGASSPTITEYTCGASASGVGDNLGDHSATQNINMNGSQVTNIGTPVNAGDAVTKSYADRRTRSGVATVGFTNGQPHSSFAHVTFSPSCTNPIVVTQTYSDSISCGNGSGPTTCPSYSSSSEDLESYAINVTSTGFDVFLSAMDGVWVGATSPAFRIGWIATCQ